MTDGRGHATVGVSGSEEIIGLLAAVNDEIAPTIKALALQKQDNQHVGRIGNTAIIAKTAGIGTNHAVAALNSLIDQGATKIIQLGFAGGLDPQYQAGELLNLEAVMTESDAPIVLPDQPEAATSVFPANPVTLLTLDRIADSVNAKRELFEAYAAVAVDMESYFTVRAAAERGIPLTLLRAISDPANMALPSVVSQWVKPDGRPDMAKAMSYVASHPLQAPMLMKLNAHAKVAARNLATRIVSLLRI